MRALFLASFLLVACGDSAADLRTEYVLEGDALYPEGVGYDEVSRRFFVGSLSEGDIRSLELDGTQSIFGTAPEEWSTLGLAISASRRELWTCASPTVGSSELWLFDLDSGELLERVALEAAAAAARCNDLDIATDGSIYVTDPTQTNVYRAARGEAASVFATDALFTPELLGLGLNGIALTPGGTHLVVAKYTAPTLFLVSIADPSDVREVALTGDRLMGEDGLSGADGLAFLGDELLVVLGDTIQGVTLDLAAGTGTVRTLPLGEISGYTTAAIAEGHAYAVKGEAANYALGRDPDLPFRITRIASE